MSDDEEETTCPLCMEEMDLSDKNFLPCPCSYRVCIWCWHHIRENLNGLCPACRTPYNPDPHAFSAVDRQEIVKKNRERKQKEKQEKKVTDKPAINGNKPIIQTIADRRHLHNYRVVQRNLIYVVGIPGTMATEELLRKPEYFGQYGKIGKIVIHRNHSPTQTSVSAYITFIHKDDAKAAIQSLEGFFIDGYLIRASFGTTKYCNNFIRGVACSNPDCVYLHELGDDDDRFTKEEIQAGQSKLIPTPGQNQSLITGNGGPSGTGKKPVGDPVFPPPMFIQDNIPTTTTSTTSVTTSSTPAVTTSTRPTTTTTPTPTPIKEKPLWPLPPHTYNTYKENSTNSNNDNSNTATTTTTTTIATTNGVSTTTTSMSRTNTLDPFINEKNGDNDINSRSMSDASLSPILSSLNQKSSLYTDENTKVSLSSLDENIKTNSSNNEKIFKNGEINTNDTMKVQNGIPAIATTITTDNTNTISPSSNNSKPKSLNAELSLKKLLQLDSNNQSTTGVNSNNTPIASQITVGTTLRNTSSDMNTILASSNNHSTLNNEMNVFNSMNETTTLSTSATIGNNALSSTIDPTTTTTTATANTNMDTFTSSSTNTTSTTTSISKVIDTNIHTISSSTSNNNNNTANSSSISIHTVPIATLLMKRPDFHTQPTYYSAFNGITKNILFPTPISTFTVSIWSSIISVTNDDLKINPYEKLKLSFNEYIDLTLPPVDAIALVPWPRPMNYYTISPTPPPTTTTTTTTTMSYNTMSSNNTTNMNATATSSSMNSSGKDIFNLGGNNSATAATTSNNNTTTNNIISNNMNITSSSTTNAASPSVVNNTNAVTTAQLFLQQSNLSTHEKALYLLRLQQQQHQLQQQQQQNNLNSQMNIGNSLLNHMNGNGTNLSSTNTNNMNILGMQMNTNSNNNSIGNTVNTLLMNTIQSNMMNSASNISSNSGFKNNNLSLNISNNSANTGMSMNNMSTNIFNGNLSSNGMNNSYNRGIGNTGMSMESNSLLGMNTLNTKW